MHGRRTTLDKEYGSSTYKQKTLSPGLGFTVMQNQLATAAKTLKDRGKEKKIVDKSRRQISQVSKIKKKTTVHKVKPPQSPQRKHYHVQSSDIVKGWHKAGLKGHF